MSDKPESLPTLFVSHGAPTMPLEAIPARAFLAGLGDLYREVEAVLCVSAHWATSRPTVNAAAEPDTIHDFYGFPAELYEIEYPAHGAPDLARRVAGLLESTGIACDIDPRRGLDHGCLRVRCLTDAHQRDKWGLQEEEVNSVVMCFEARAGCPDRQKDER